MNYIPQSVKSSKEAKNRQRREEKGNGLQKSGSEVCSFGILVTQSPHWLIGMIGNYDHPLIVSDG